MTAPGGQGQPDPMWMLLAILVMIFLLGWFLWHEFRPQGLEALRYIRFWELWFVNLFTGHEGPCLHWLQVVGPDTKPPTPPSADAVYWTNQCFGAGNLAKLPADRAAVYYVLTGVSVGAVAGHTFPLFRWITVAASVAFIVYALYFSPRNKFKTTYNMESFIKIQAKVWPVISPIVNFNPNKYSARQPGQAVPDKLPPFAEALSPEEWLSWHRIPVTNGICDRETTRRALVLQLGPRWEGIEGQPPYFVALFAAYALKGVQRREESDDLLGRLAQCWTVQKGFVMPGPLAAEVNRLARDPAVGGEAVKIADQHAFRTTALLGVLKWARFMGGVLAPAQFTWVRAVDRNLWYPLNNLGRRSFHAEGAGALAHFMAEQNAKKPLPIPRVDTAIHVINQFLADPEKRPMPIPPREEPEAAGKKKKR